MAEIISSNKTIAKNTLFLYARMLFNLVVSLYTSRVILDVLGVTDLGVFQVVAGITGSYGALFAVLLWFLLTLFWTKQLYNLVQNKIGGGFFLYFPVVACLRRFKIC